MNTNSLAKKLKALRTSRGMSQEYLAEESRVSLRTIQRIENEASVPTGETIKRIAMALDVAVNTLVDSKMLDETSNLNGSIIFFKRLLSKTNTKDEIRTFKRFIAILSNLKQKDLSEDQLQTLEAYLYYLELEKIPSYSYELYKPKLNQLRKYLKTKFKFVPNTFYTSVGIAFAVPFAVSFSVTNSIVIGGILGLIFLGIGLLLDVRIKKQGRNLNF